MAIRSIEPTDNILTPVCWIRCASECPRLEGLLPLPPTAQMLCTTRALLTNFLDLFNKLLAVYCEHNGISENRQQLYTPHNYRKELSQDQNEAAASHLHTCTPAHRARAYVSALTPGTGLNEDFCLLACDVVWSATLSRMFSGNILALSSDLKTAVVLS
jgi:hypothetical protein